MKKSLNNLEAYTYLGDYNKNKNFLDLFSITESRKKSPPKKLKLKRNINTFINIFFLVVGLG